MWMKPHPPAKDILAEYSAGPQVPQAGRPDQLVSSILMLLTEGAGHRQVQGSALHKTICTQALTLLHHDWQESCADITYADKQQITLLSHHTFTGVPDVNHEPTSSRAAKSGAQHIGSY